MTETTQRAETKNSIDTNICPVNSYNEWDPLEEVIVGRVDGSRIAPSHFAVTYTIPPSSAKFYPFFAGRRYPGFLIKRAQRELDEFIHILKSEGIVVRQPDTVDFSVRYKTPHWKSHGFGTTCPRDGVLVVGDELIETPMAWRSRYFEVHAYRSLFKEYFAQGARWTAAPKPQLLDSLYNYDLKPQEKNQPLQYVINDSEPVFDAADFVRCGQDLFVTKSNVTNDSGITWLRRHLGDKYRIHEIESLSRNPMHIDTTFMPLAPGKVMINPEYVDPSKLPKILKSWDILIPPNPDPVSGFILSMCSKWISLNVLMLDEKRVMVEKSQTSLQKAMKDWGFEPISCPFGYFSTFGGSFHCATLDIRRKGGLQSYF
ncbi:MAG: amidinotransferase [Rhizonema sp. PD38]|nr:amidinotransferase [Rhizonema sp. PD38]